VRNDGELNALAVSKVTLLGLDGASLPLIQAWNENGVLPGFSRLFKEGGWGGLRSTIPPISPSAWTSIFSGVTPAKHGIFGFIKRRQNSYTPRPIGGIDVHVPLLWRILSERHVKSAWVHIPFVYPPDPIEGVMITGLGTPSKNSEFVYPKEMKAELLRRYPDFDVDFNEDGLELSHNIAESITKIEKVTASTIEIFKDMRADPSFRLVGSVFRELDVIQHFKMHEPDKLLPYYQKFDRLIQHCLDHKLPDETLIVCSDHGFREVTRRFHINNWLESLGMLRMRRKGLLAKLGIKAENFQRILVQLGLKKLVWRIKRSKMADLILQTLPSNDFNYGIDWTNTKAYYIGNEAGTVYLNLVNREPNGILNRGHESKAALMRIINSAREIKDPSTGQPVISQACETDELYQDCPSDAPDALMVEDDGYTFSGRYNYGGELFTDVGARRGDHSMDGILFMHGNRIAHKQILGAAVWDIAPTILHILDIPIPEYFDGRTLEESLTGFPPATKPESSANLERSHIAMTIERMKRSGKI